MTTPQLELVNSEAHKDLRVNPQHYNIPENQINACVVVASELLTLCHEYPVFVTKHEQRDQFQLMALLGLKSGQNLFLDGDNWRATYLPLDVLRKPFQAYIPDPKEPTKGNIAIDINSPSVNDSGQLLFSETGEATEYFQRIEKTFAQLMGGSSYSADVLKQADELGLLEPVSLDIDLPNGEKTSINGIYQFDKEKLSALKGKDLELCHQTGILQISHLTMSSAIHIDKLIKWHVEK